jgi:putative hydrolase of the HAD superfamily
MIKNIVFDMGGVLLDLDRPRCIEAFTRLGFPQADTMLGHYAQTGILGELEAGTATPAAFYDYVRRESRRPLSDEQIAAALNAFVIGLPVYKLQMLRSLAPRHGVYLLSNTNAIMMPDIRERYFTQLPGLTFDDYFTRAFLSYEMGVIKPAAEIFHKMIAEAAFDPAECLFIDDGAANVEVAARLGFHTYQPRPREDFRAVLADI